MAKESVVLSHERHCRYIEWVAYTWKICNLQGSHTFDEGNVKNSEIVKTGQLEGCHHLFVAMHVEVRIGISLKACYKNSMSPRSADLATSDVRRKPPIV